MAYNDNYAALKRTVEQLTAEERLAEVGRLWDLLDAKVQGLMLLIVDSFASFHQAYNGPSRRREPRNAQTPCES